ncbi:MAG: TIGR00730 family Rossman fold protein [Myxococcales bacterium]|nr:TIGR00730 family Rossman fold protein [Myxococcales bacterium]MCB9718358.1 TIGR00730 family Rossman fold protein [Myxococcales bacterium]
MQRLCVYCASSPGTNAAITTAARRLGELMVAEGIELVYGGGTVGLMGLVADTVMAGGGAVTGVIPTRLFPREIPHRGLTHLVEVGSMHERKTTMFELSDAFIALPGGFGTLEEVAEVTTWAQLGIHDKPIGLLDVDGYYGALLAWLDRAVRDGLLRPENRALLLHADEPAAMLAALRAYAPRTKGRQWLDLGET